MKTKLKTLAAISLAVCLAGNVHAQIPVTDGTSIATQVKNQVEQLGKWAQQYQQLQAQIDQYKKQYEAITGARGMGDLLNSSAAKTALPQDWQDLLSSIKTTQGYLKKRQQYPTLPNMPKTNSMYDTIASQNALMEDLYSKTNARINQVQQLMRQIDRANDPAAKMDLTNRLISEQNAIQATQNLVSILQSKQKQEMEEAGRLASQEITCLEFGKKSC